MSLSVSSSLHKYILTRPIKLSSRPIYFKSLTLHMAVPGVSPTAYDTSDRVHKTFKIHAQDQAQI